MPDANGNLTSLGDFSILRPFRLISYLDPDVAFACDPSGWAYVHRLSSGPPNGWWPDEWDSTIFSTGNQFDLAPASTEPPPGCFFLLHSTVDYWDMPEWYLQNSPRQLTWQEYDAGPDVSYPLYNGDEQWRAPIAMCTVPGISNNTETLFTADFVDGCWFALNSWDRRVVVDVLGSGTQENNPISGWQWNGGDNQRWRAEIIPRFRPTS